MSITNITLEQAAREAGANWMPAWEGYAIGIHDLIALLNKAQQRDELLAALQLLETAARRFADKSDSEPSYTLKMCAKARAAIARAEKSN
jgi:hypothetical protein